MAVSRNKRLRAFQTMRARDRAGSNEMRGHGQIAHSIQKACGKSLGVHLSTELHDPQRSSSVSDVDFRIGTAEVFRHKLERMERGAGLPSRPPDPVGHSRLPGFVPKSRVHVERE